MKSNKHINFKKGEWVVILNNTWMVEQYFRWIQWEKKSIYDD